VVVGSGDPGLGGSVLGEFELGESELGESELGEFELGESELGESELGESELGDPELSDGVGDEVAFGPKAVFRWCDEALLTSGPQPASMTMVADTASVGQIGFGFTSMLLYLLEHQPRAPTCPVWLKYEMLSLVVALRVPLRAGFCPVVFRNTFLCRSGSGEAA
jgi:hypothetical protein